MSPDRPGTLRLLALASRSSDYVEMAEVAVGLAARGHEVTLGYAYSESAKAAHVPTLEQLKALDQTHSHVRGELIEIDEIIEGAALGPTPVGRRATSAEGAPSSRRRRPSLDAGLSRLREWAVRHHYRPSPRLSRVRRVVRVFAQEVDRMREPRQIARDLWWSLRQAAEFLRALLKILTRLPWRFYGRAPLTVAEAMWMIWLYRRFHAFFDRMIRDRAFDAVLMPEDIVGHLWPVAIKAGHDNGVPALVLPYTLANQEEAVQSLRDQPAYQTSHNSIVAHVHSRWRWRRDGVDLVRLPSPHVFAHERLGISPPHPWMMNSGYSDAILVDSRASFDYFVAGGIPAEQIEVVGSVSQDRMYRLRQDRARHLSELRQSLELEGEKPLLLVSGCPNQLAAKVPYCEFENFAGIAAFVGESLATLAGHYHLIVRPHPNFPEFGPMLAAHGVVSTLVPTSSLVPLADAFVAFASATIRWAIVCGIPTVNYDVFHYGYGDFASARGVVSVNEKAQFRDAVADLAPDSPSAARLRERARADGAQWGVMDGCALDRIEAAIHEARTARGSSTRRRVAPRRGSAA